MPGGIILVEIGPAGEILMTGAVEGVFEGTLHKDLIKKLTADLGK